MKAGAILVAVVAAAGFSLAAPREARACIDADDAGCPCTWDNQIIPVYAWTSGNSSYSLLNIPGAAGMSASDWESVIQTAINIYREESPLPRKLYFAGHVSDASVNRYGIVFRGQPALPNSCNIALAQRKDQATGSSITWSSIEIRHSQDKGFGAGCLQIPWSPTQQAGSYDLVGVIMHELMHAFGFDHPNTAPYSNPNDPTQAEGCGLDVASVVRSSAQEYMRHLSRYDKEAISSLYGYRLMTGRYRSFDDPTETWSSAATWPLYAGSPLLMSSRPKSLSQYGPLTYAAWELGLGGSMWSSRSNAANSWTNTLSNTVSNWSSPAVASNRTGKVRQYYLQESNTDNVPKKIAYTESLNGGLSWGPETLLQYSGDPVTTRRDGIAAAYDEITDSFLVVYTTDGTKVEGDPTLTKGNVLTLITESSAGVTKKATFGHSTFATPTIACSPLNATDRCIIGFSTADLRPFLRWIEGSITSSGTWLQTADRYDTNRRLDFSPTIAWSNAGQRFLLGINRRYGTTSKTWLYYKTKVTNAVWAGETTFTGVGITYSAGAMSSTLAPDKARYYYAEYEE